MEALPSTLCGGNLSALKKRWEQQQQQEPPSIQRSQSQAPLTPVSTLPGSRSAPSSQIKLQQDSLKTTVLSQDQDTEIQVHRVTRETSQDMTDMEAKPSRDSEEQEGAAASAASAAEVPECEKPSIPLNSLKMMFEKGESPEKASTASL